jgi:hypothetical protein
MSATKIIDAYYHAVRLALNRGEIQLAKERLQTSIRRGRELLTGSWFNTIGYDDAPVTFGMHDLTQTMDYLVRSSYMLHQISSWNRRPAQALETSMGLFERSLDAERKVNRMWSREYQDIVNYNQTLQTERDEQIANLSYLENARIEILNSRSWQITRPIRAFSRFIRYGYFDAGGNVTILQILRRTSRRLRKLFKHSEKENDN